MDKQAEIRKLFDYLREVAERVSRSRHGCPEKIFELARTGKYPDYIVDMAESFGMMIVKVEAREFRLEKNLQQLQNLNQELQNEITQKNNFEKALIESEGKFRTIVKNMPDGLFIFQQQKIVFYNQRLPLILGYKPETDLTNKTVASLINPKNWKLIQEKSDLIHKGSSQFEQLILMIRQRYSSFIYLDTLLSPITFQKRPAMLCTIRDITERLRLEQELQRAQKLESLGRLSGGIAHDFNNILSVINGYTEILLGEKNLPEKYRKYIEEIDTSGKQATKLIHQLLTFSKRQVVNLEYIPLNQKISELVTMLRKLIGEDIGLNVKLHPDQLYIKANSGQIEQVILNLVLNARDAIRALDNPDAKRLITIETIFPPSFKNIHQIDDLSAGTRYVQLSISDTGVGISNEINYDIFDPFFTTKTDHESTGFGLATVYGIVKQNQGHIRFHSIPNKLTTFNIFWPVAQLDQVDKQIAATETESLKGNESILLVEDQASVRSVITIILKSLGYQITAVNSGEEALAVIKPDKSKYDLLLSDIILPKMNGITLTEEVKKILPTIKILLMSGYPREELLKEFPISDKIQIVYKPFTKEIIARNIKKILTADS
jgi:two-component system cell cycle sensor histidine kinase/response regulator CckA